jgi:multicomponent K+:H+ antiporter subunit A
VLFALIAGSWPFVEGAWHGYVQLGPTLPSLEVDAAFVAVWSMGLLATAATVIVYRQRLLALLMLGLVGLVVSLGFVYFSAPDLALTQLLVEVATIILMMLALHWLPESRAAHIEDSRWHRGRDALVAVAAGAGVAALAYMVLGRPFDSIAPYYLANTLSQGGGANAVNVIIVDFRGFDTLGEITVMGIAALIVHALLNGFKPDVHPQLADSPKDSHPLMLVVVSRLLLPLAALVSVHLYLRGHNLPGGGFIAGLLLAIVLVLQFVASGQGPASRGLQVNFSSWVGWGLLIAGGSGLASWFFGAPFLTTTYDYPVWPWVGAVPLASAAIFDLGVFLTVTGATMVALLAMAKLSSAHPKEAS